MEIKKINIIGFGNVGQTLFKQLRNKVEIESVYSRSVDEKNNMLISNKLTNNLNTISRHVDLNIVAVKDDAIFEVQKLLPTNIPTVHTSGGVGIEILSNFDTRGILYPLQTFSRNKDVVIEEVPFLIEGSTRIFEDRISNFVKKNLSKTILKLDSEKRKYVHLSAVITNNFLTYFLSVAEDILKKNNVPSEILLPLLRETLSKSFENGAQNSLTGPAIRGDFELIEEYLKIIKNEDFRGVFSAINKQIYLRNFNVL